MFPESKWQILILLLIQVTITVLSFTNILQVEVGQMVIVSD